MKRLSSVFLLAVILLPSVQAWHLSPLPDPEAGQVRDTRNRVVATRTENLDNAAPGNLLTYTFPWDPEFTYDTIGHTIRVHLGYTIQHPSTSNGAWTVNVAKEATGNLDSCSIRIETVDPIGISLDAVPVTQHFAWDCLFTQSTKPHFHYHTIYVNRSVASGSPSAPTAESIAVRLETEDIVIISMPTNFEALTGLTGPEFFAIMALGLGCLVLAAYAKQPIARFSSAVLLILLGLLLLSFTSSAVIVVLAAVLLLLGALAFLQVSLEWTRTTRAKKQPRRFFE